MQFGYLKAPDRTGAFRGQEVLKDALRAFQRMAGINQTGNYMVI